MDELCCEYCGYGTPEGESCVHCGRPLYPRITDGAQCRFTGGLNVFLWDGTCRVCGRRSQLMFLANAGEFAYTDFSIGDVVPGGPLSSRWDTQLTAPGPRETSYWVFGQGSCFECNPRALLWGRVEIRANLFTRIAMIDRPSQPDWHIEWGRLDPSNGSDSTSTAPN